MVKSTRPVSITNDIYASSHNSDSLPFLPLLSFLHFWFAALRLPRSNLERRQVARPRIHSSLSLSLFALMSTTTATCYPANNAKPRSCIRPIRGNYGEEASWEAVVSIIAAWRNAICFIPRPRPSCEPLCFFPEYDTRGSERRRNEFSRDRFETFLKRLWPGTDRMNSTWKFLSLENASRESEENDSRFKKKKRDEGFVFFFFSFFLEEEKDRSGKWIVVLIENDIRGKEPFPFRPILSSCERFKFMRYYNLWMYTYKRV